jgi:hypothetical protein
MRALAVALLILGLAAVSRAEGPVAETRAVYGVRAVSALAGQVIEQARARSATVRALLDELAASDVLVYVDFQFDPPVARGTTTLVTASAHGRYLRIAVDVLLSPPDRLGVLAHELQHAVEIARDSSVRDDAALRALYKRIGWAVGRASFETQAAVDTERRARRDLQRAVDPDLA